LKEAGAQILEAIASSGDWVHGSIWVYDESAGVLRCKTTWHPPNERMEKFAEVSRSIEFARGEGLPGRVWASKKPTWIEDVTIDTNFPRARVAAEVGLRGGFAFPLRVDGTVNGIIEIFSRQPVHPDQDLLHLVDALGIQIGLFIERRRIEQELKAEKERAEAANAAKDRFLAMLSHELRTPLTPVLIWAGGTSRQPDLDPEIKEGLQMICRNIELEARLIDDMLDLTRITRGKLEVRLGSADVHELLRRAMDIVRSEVEDRGARVSVALEATDHSLVVDSQRLQQVFWNILRNAYKFTPAEGEIAVRTYNPGPDTIAVEISDNGVGIEPKFLEKIFDAFEQVDTRREGLGLGLAISKAIIEAHGGTIRARSDGPGKGATFAIELPTRSRTESGAPG
jgi:signal transduction histidine kinase